MTTVPTPAVPTPPIESKTPGTWQGYLTSAIGAVVAVVDLFHPGWTQPTIVTALVPSVSALAAAGVAIFDIVTKRSVTKARLAAKASQ